MQIEFRTKNAAIRSEIESFLDEWRSKDSFCVNTSGSTGRPKSISIKKVFAESSARKTLDYFNLEEGNKALFCLSPETIAGKMMLVRAIVGNLKLIVSDINSTPLESIMENEKLDLSAMVPLQVDKSLIRDSSKMRNIRNLIIGGAGISEKLEKEILSFQLKAFHSFGMTETISHIALRQIDGKQPIYKALKNTIFSQGKEGNLIIDSPDIGVHKLETNDLVKLLDENSFLWIGRKDNVINTGGIKVYPEQIETKLNTKQNIFISSLRDETLGNCIILCVEGNSFDLNLFDSLTKFERPKYIYYFDSFIYTNSNKINRIETTNHLSDARKQIL